MSLLWTVYVLIEERGPSSCDDLLPLCKGSTRKQVQAAMLNAAARGMIRLKERRGRTGVYEVGRRAEKQELPEPAYVRPVNSVFQLGGIA